jgi:hypothetical protein
VGWLAELVFNVLCNTVNKKRENRGKKEGQLFGREGSEKPSKILLKIVERLTGSTLKFWFSTPFPVKYCFHLVIVDDVSIILNNDFFVTVCLSN